MCTENHVCTYHGTRYHGTYVPLVRVRTWYYRYCTIQYCSSSETRPFGLYVRTYVRTYNVMSQLSDWKRAHMCTENHVYTCTNG
jgi:hypothetical protein